MGKYKKNNKELTAQVQQLQQQLNEMSQINMEMAKQLDEAKAKINANPTLFTVTANTITSAGKHCYNVAAKIAKQAVKFGKKSVELGNAAKKEIAEDAAMICQDISDTYANISEAGSKAVSEMNTKLKGFGSKVSSFAKSVVTAPARVANDLCIDIMQDARDFQNDIDKTAKLHYESVSKRLEKKIIKVQDFDRAMFDLKNSAKNLFRVFLGKGVQPNKAVYQISQKLADRVTDLSSRKIGCDLTAQGYEIEINGRTKKNLVSEYKKRKYEFNDVEESKLNQMIEDVVNNSKDKKDMERFVEFVNGKDFSVEQLEVIESAIDLDVSDDGLGIFAKTEFTSAQMNCLKSALVQGYPMENIIAIARPEFHQTQMYIALGIMEKDGFTRDDALKIMASPNQFDTLAEVLGIDPQTLSFEQKDALFSVARDAYNVSKDDILKIVSRNPVPSADEIKAEADEISKNNDEYTRA